MYECTVCAVLRAVRPSGNTFVDASLGSLTSIHRRRRTVRTRSLSNSGRTRPMFALARRRFPGPAVRTGAGFALATAFVMPTPKAIAIAPAVTVVRDVAYGADPKQRFDVYIPRGARNAPVVLMVHGGAWRIGDKRSRGVVGNKVDRGSRDGIVVIAVNYRMLPGTDPVE